MANFFIDRPIFAWVLAILLCLTGTLAILSLPVEQYPDLAPPNVRITANYPGASAQTLENTVTQVIEQNMTGLDNLMYMSSQSSATGQATITLSFTAGTDPDEAVQQVQNQLQSAMRKLPQAVQNQGVTVRKTGDTNILTSPSSPPTAAWINRISPTTSPVTFRTRSAASTAWGYRRLRFAILNAHLARPGEAQQLPDDHQGCHRRHQFAERPDCRRPAWRDAFGR
jgi:hypothetical protein